MGLLTYFWLALAVFLGIFFGMLFAMAIGYWVSKSDQSISTEEQERLIERTATKLAERLLEEERLKERL